MGYSVATIVCKGVDEVELFVFGDPHYGSPDRDKKLIAQGIQYVLDKPNCYAITVGDNLDLSVKDKFGVIGIDEAVDKAINDFDNDFYDLAKSGKLIGTVPGNHDIRISKAVGSPIDLVKQLIRGWNKEKGVTVHYGEPSLVLDVKLDLSSFLGLLHHGSGGGGTAGAIVNSIEKHLNLLSDADFFIQGHFHRPTYHNITRRTYHRPKKVITTQSQHFFTVSSCLKAASYAEAARMKATEASATILTFKSQSKNGRKRKRIEHRLFYPS